MNADKILSRTFAEHEYLVPDARDILADLHQELAGRRRRRVTHILTALGAVASVATIAVGVAAIGGGHRASDHTAAPAGTTPTSTLQVTRPAPSTAIPAPDRLTIGAGWLPGKATDTQRQAHNEPSGQQRSYEVSADGLSYEVILALDPGSELPAESKDVIGRDATVNGHPAREFARDGFFEVAFQTAGKVAYAYVTPTAAYDGNPAFSAANLTRIGRHVAQSMQFNRNDKIHTSAVLTYLPAGVTIVGLEASDGGMGGTSYLMSGPDGNAAAVDVGGSEAGVAPGIGSAGRPVQGHRTEVITWPNGGSQLAVYEFRPGVSISLVTGAGVSTLEDLYRIAEGIRWVG